MLKLLIDQNLSDVNRINEILEKYQVDADISDNSITIRKYLDYKVLKNILKELKPYGVQNHRDQVETINNCHQLITPKYPVVKRGEVYRCDFWFPYGSEQGFERYAIIIQNDDGNLHSPTTIVLACTTEDKKDLIVHIVISFSEENMIDYNEEIIGTEVNTILGEQIKTVDKTRLKEYLGTLTPEFMDNQIQRIIEKSLALKMRKPIEKKIYVESKRDTNRKDLNMNQVIMLSNISIQKLLKIKESSKTTYEKCTEILELFNFDIKKNGIQYLIKTILNTPKYEQYNLENLIERIGKIEELTISEDEVKRLIVARVKETLKIKGCTIDFIRLVNCFIRKGDF